jgi:hypothetical protein
VFTQCSRVNLQISGALAQFSANFAKKNLKNCNFALKVCTRSSLTSFISEVVFKRTPPGEKSLSERVHTFSAKTASFVKT